MKPINQYVCKKPRRFFIYKLIPHRRANVTLNHAADATFYVEEVKSDLLFATSYSVSLQQHPTLCNAIGSKGGNREA